MALRQLLMQLLHELYKLDKYSLQRGSRQYRMGKDGTVRADAEFEVEVRYSTIAVWSS